MQSIKFSVALVTTGRQYLLPNYLQPPHPLLQWTASHRSAQSDPSTAALPGHRQLHRQLASSSAEHH
jgi:hypothetical protein